MMSDVTSLKRTLSPGTNVVTTFNDKQCEAINALLATGYWGGTASEVVRRLIDSALIREASNETQTT